MTTKELSYVEDSLGHEQFLMQQCKTAASALTDKELSAYVKKLGAKHDKIFDRFYKLV